MAVSKITTPPTPQEEINKINEIIDNLGEAGSANQNLSNLSSVGEARLHALKGYADEGELLTDAKGLSDVTNYAHSTFDISKFTVVGSPTISADGILNATTNNYPKSPTINFSTASSWKIKTKFKTPTTTAELSLYSGYSTPKVAVVYGTNKKFRFAVGDGSSWFLSNIEGTHTFSLDTEYEVSLEFNGTNYTLYVDGIQEATSASSSKIADAPLLFGVDRSGAAAYSPDGIIDLKTVNVVLDGTTVFSGNKTGIDTVKPDDYTKVGSPTISADGIASGFGDSNYLSKSLDFSSANSWEIQIPFKTPSISSNSRVIDRVSGSTNLILIRVYGSVCGVSLNVNSSEIFRITNDTFNITLDTEYLVKIGYDGTSYYAKYNTGGADTTINTVTSSTKWSAAVNHYIGRGNTNGDAYKGSIDLNAFKIYTNGNLIYQACLKIPYIESKTGSKIVDSVYRYRVNDMYNQYGYAPYYTLSDSDFTLPQGEVYGLMNTVGASAGMPSNTFDSLTLGASGSTYIAPADGYFYLSKATSGADQFLRFQNLSLTSFAFYVRGDYPAAGSLGSIFIPVRSGDTVKVEYSAGGATGILAFIYAEGTKQNKKV